MLRLSSRSGAVRSASLTSDHQRTGSPSMAAIRSPGASPAASAGELRSTKPITASARGSPTACIPTKIATGSTRFMAGPANTMASFCQSGFPPRVSEGWARASGESTSSGFSPSIFTKPPSGNHAITYSVSPRTQRRR
jgi:hypothetical protein